MSAKNLALGLSVVLAANALLLIGVARNRSAGPIQTIELTERELPMMARGEEDSSVNLRFEYRPRYLRWRGDAGISENTEGLLDSEKLQTLGFQCGTPDASSPYYRVPLRRLEYVALEYMENPPEESAGKAGPVPSVAGQRSEQAIVRSQSRLKVVDAARSFNELRLKYPDRRKHLIVRGLVLASAVNDPNSANHPRWIGRVSDVLPSMIQVPLPFSIELNRLAAEDRKSSHYTVTVHYGRDLEPWIGSITVNPR
jgi:hypothetical protein